MSQYLKATIQPPEEWGGRYVSEMFEQIAVWSTKLSNIAINLRDTDAISEEDVTVLFDVSEFLEGIEELDNL